MESIEKSIQDQRVLLDAIHATLVTTQELGSKVITTRETQALSRLPKIPIFLNTEADVERVQAFADIDGGSARAALQSPRYIGCAYSLPR
jgi:hypothetical protein